jgi:hypothetical protein
MTPCRPGDSRLVGHALTVESSYLGARLAGAGIAAAIQCTAEWPSSKVAQWPQHLPGEVTISAEGTAK